ncbi:MAG TPA: CrcB family protein, partial [Rhodopila sp.]|nr:CrcB family protein [Rhodopila sp.]
GGFTTFSSFSLQTLELARDGRMAQALGNIGLSVVLCLLSVTAGHYSATAIHRPQAAAGAAAGGTIGVVLAVLNQPDQAAPVLSAAMRLLEIGGGGRLEVLAVRTPPAAAILPSEEVLTAERSSALRAKEENWSGRLRDAAEAWASSRRGAGGPLHWREAAADAAEAVAEHGRRADAIVLPRAARHDSANHDSERMRACVHAALFDTGSPVLLVPPGHQAPFGHVVAIAWKDDARAAEAVRACLPLLRQAQRVHVITAGSAPQMPPILSEQDIPTELHAVPEAGEATAERILASARRVGADLLVMGAFAHGAWRELMFGGITRTMLAHADLPLFLRH